MRPWASSACWNTFQRLVFYRNTFRETNVQGKEPLSLMRRCARIRNEMEREILLLYRAYLCRHTRTHRSKDRTSRNARLFRTIAVRTYPVEGKIVRRLKNSSRNKYIGEYRYVKPDPAWTNFRTAPIKENKTEDDISERFAKTARTHTSK